MMQPEENGKNPNFRTNLGSPKFFSQVLFLPVVRQCSKLSFYAISMKTNKPDLRKWQKPNFGPNFDLFGPSLTQNVLY